VTPRETTLSRLLNPNDLADVLRLTIVLTLVGAAVIHAKVTPEHFEEWVAAGVFFIVITALQAALAAALLLSRRRGLYLTALIISAATVMLWLVSRITGLPFGPNSGTPEEMGRPDIVSTILEVATMGATLPLLRNATPLNRPGRSGARWAFVAVVAVMVAAATWFALAS
jgi:hypothetical protein